MKRIALLFAATAVLASCMKENSLAPEQTNDNLVTIKAVAAETKTVLNGTDVVWENNDAIKVVFNSEDKIYTSVFTTQLAETSSNADFTGVIDKEVTVEACGDAGYAIYPSDVDVESDGQIEFNVNASQTGKVASGTNLSYAAVSLNDIMTANKTTVAFKNALSLIKITVPAGVKAVTVSSEAANDEDKTPLAGKAPFYYADGNLTINTERWGDSEVVVVPGEEPETVSVPLKYYSVVLEKTDKSILAEGTYYVHVFPGTHEALTVTVDGTDFSYTKTIDSEYTFAASEYRTLNIANIFNLKENEFFVSPFGGSVDLPIVTTLDDYEVSVSQEGSWLTETPAAKGAFRKDVLSYTAAENTTGIERSATVTITSGSETLAEVSVTQKGYIPALVNDFLESYKKSGMPYTGTLKIEETDDASQGVYKVTICGETRYADYADGTLTIHDGNNERLLTVSADFKTISAANLSIGYSSITEYKAILPLGEAVLTEAEQALVGRYDESWLYDNNAATPDAGVMQISVSDEASYGQLRVRFLAINSSYFDAYAQLDGNQLKVKIGGLKHGYFGEVYNPDEILAMTVNEDGTLTFDSFYSSKEFKYVTEYRATKSDEEPVQGLAGTWFAEYDGADYSWSGFSAYSKKSSSIIISEGSSENEYIITNFLGFECTPNANPSYDYSLAARLEGNTLTIAAKNQYPEMVFTYTDGQLLCNNEYEIAYQLKFTNIVATR
ncbi:MAG: hypothetical protein IKC68_00115 [Bacteroidales bacterium]|nr:hypothetical protein [Bacteroidales bacterium]